MYIMIPIYIIAYNQFTYIRNMVYQCLPLTDKIYIIDNASTYQPLLDWYKNELPKLKNIELIRHPENGGSRVYQKYIHLFPDEYVITDPDLLFNPKMPNDVINILSNIRKKFNVKVVGLALDISDRSNFTNAKFHAKSIYEWESAFWKNKVNYEQEEIYIAKIATTFALHSKSNNSKTNLRVAGRFTCKHIPWYRKEKSPLPISNEEKTAVLKGNRTTNWCKNTLY